MNLNLLSNTSRVETPFIIAEIAGYSFGIYSRNKEDIPNYTSIKVQYPNYMQSLTVTKINGTVNTYTLVMRYAIIKGDDPNLLEKVFSKASKDRTIILSYGDLSMPSFIYKKEEAVITSIKSNLDVNSSSITYTINCTSKALSLAAGTYSFPKRVAKPSDVIKEILYNNKYGLLDIFYGMRDKEKVLAKGLIAGDDKSVTIEAQKHMSVLQYLNYLINCMSNIENGDNTTLKKDIYAIVVVDSTTNDFDGPYFKVSKITNNIQTNTLNTYEIDVGYRDDNMVSNFTINDNEVYSILYDYASSIKQTNYIYRIDNNGKIDYSYSPALTNSNQLMKTTEADKTWWSQMTQYPISASLTIKGLLRPAILMNYLKINTLFYGHKHISSGYYIITKQIDTIDTSGYKTNLSLTRIQGDDLLW